MFIFLNKYSLFLYFSSFVFPGRCITSPLFFCVCTVYKTLPNWTCTCSIKCKTGEFTDANNSEFLLTFAQRVSFYRDQSWCILSTKSCVEIHAHKLLVKFCLAIKNSFKFLVCMTNYIEFLQLLSFSGTWPSNLKAGWSGRRGVTGNGSPPGTSERFSRACACPWGQ